MMVNVYFGWKVLKISFILLAFWPQFLKLKYINKGMDDINLSNILHDKRTYEKVPQYFQNRPPPVISYKYSNTIAAMILNFNATLRNIDIDDFIKSPPSCDCASSPFRYRPQEISYHSK